MRTVRKGNRSIEIRGHLVSRGIVKYEIRKLGYVQTKIQIVGIKADAEIESILDSELRNTCVKLKMIAECNNHA